MERVDFEDIVRMNRAGDEVRNVHLNIGTGREVSIRGLAELIGATVGFGGRLAVDGCPGIFFVAEVFTYRLLFFGLNK